MRKTPRIVIGAIVLFGFLGLHAAHAEWWDRSFRNRVKINVDTSAGGVQLGEGQRDFTVLLRLHKGNIRFDEIVDQERATDIRFVGVDKNTQLPFHIDTFDVINEILLVWVRIPEVKANTVENVIWMYYGKEAAESVQNPGGSYDGDTVAALHFNEREGAFLDVTQFGNNSQPYASHGLSAVIGRGVSVVEPLVLPLKTAVEPTGAVTVEVIFKLDPDPSDGVLLAIGRGADAIRVEYTEGRLVLIGGGGRVTANTDIVADTWYPTALTAGPAGATLYVNGMVAAETPAARLGQAVSEISFGGWQDGGRLLPGELDEVRVSRVLRSEAWLILAAATKGGATNLFRFSEGEGQDQTIDFYRLAKPFLDTNLIGWAINGVIIALGIVVAVVSVRKFGMLRNVDEDEEPFLEAANECTSITDYTALAEREEEFSNSPGYRAFAAAHSRLQRMMASGQHGKKPNPHALGDAEAMKMSAAHFASVRVAMEGWMTKESKQLYSEQILLTFGIAAAPFLGLLGTIWGVMETFTGLALSGEASILAVAPGVASALTTTLFGLLVAIPALIVYNVLNERTRNAVLRMYAFSDDYLIRIEPEVT